MKPWRWIIGLILVAALAAFGWHWVAEDPGYVLVRIRGWTAETTLVAALVVLLLAWAVIGLLWRFVRWPFGAMSRRHRRVSRQRLAEGLVALVEGRHSDAERDLHRAARYPSVRGPALLAAAEAAERRGETGRAVETLDLAAQETPRAARVLRARLLRRDGRAGDALALLSSDADSGSLTPAGLVELAEAALAAGDPRRAREALPLLQKSGELGARAYTDLEARVLAASMAAASDGATLATLWSQLPKAQRRSPAAIDAYARNAARFGQTMAAMDEVESALRREWSPLLVTTYGSLGVEDMDTRLRRAEGWLDAHPNDVALLNALGRMCVRTRLWGKARTYLERSLALEPTSAAWEALGDTCVGVGETELAQRCYRNALAVTRGEPTEVLPETPAGRLDTRSVAVEERSEHGVPRLPE
jgi:HemY protein